MDDDEKAAVRAALYRMFQENVNPYGFVAESVAHGLAHEKAEREMWEQYLPGHSGPYATVDVEPPDRGQLRISYAPQPAADLGPGEIVRTWVPRDDGSGGTYGSVLIVARETDRRFYGLRLSTTSHESGRRLLPTGAGPKDSHGRWSWVDLDHILRVHIQGVHRTAFTMDRPHFLRVADELLGRYGWAMED